MPIAHPCSCKRRKQRRKMWLPLVALQRNERATIGGGTALDLKPTKALSWITAAGASRFSRPWSMTCSRLWTCAAMHLMVARGQKMGMPTPAAHRGARWHSRRPPKSPCGRPTPCRAWVTAPKTILGRGLSKRLKQAPKPPETAMRRRSRLSRALKNRRRIALASQKAQKKPTAEVLRLGTRPSTSDDNLLLYTLNQPYCRDANWSSYDK